MACSSIINYPITHSSCPSWLRFCLSAPVLTNYQLLIARSSYHSATAIVGSSPRQISKHGRIMGQDEIGHFKQLPQRGTVWVSVPSQPFAKLHEILLRRINWFKNRNSPILFSGSYVQTDSVTVFVAIMPPPI